MAKAPRFPLTITKIENPDCFFGHEVPGPNISAEAKQFSSLSDELNRCMNDQRSPMNLSVSGITPNEAETGEVFVAKRPDDKKWYRVRVKMVTRRMAGPEATCELLDYGDEMKVNLAGVRKLPERFKSFPFQVKQFGLFGLQPQTMVTCPEDMTSSYQLCTEWDLAATVYMRKVLNDARDVRAENVGISENNVRWILIHLAHIEGTCLNEMLVNNGYACKTKTEKDYNFKEPEPFVPTYKNYHTTARPPKFLTAFQMTEKSSTSRKAVSDTEFTHSEFEDDDKTGHGKNVKVRERSHAKRMPLAPRVKDGQNAVDLEVHSDTDYVRPGKLTSEKSTVTEMRGVSPGRDAIAQNVVTSVPKLGRGGKLLSNSEGVKEMTPDRPVTRMKGVSPSRDVGLLQSAPVIPKLGRGGFLSPGRGSVLGPSSSLVFAKPQGLRKDVTGTQAPDSSEEKTELSRVRKDSESDLPPALEPVSVVGLPGGVQELCSADEEMFPSGLGGGLSKTESKKQPVDPAELKAEAISSIKSPPRKQMKPHVPAKARISPVRPTHAADKEEKISTGMSPSSDKMQALFQNGSVSATDTQRLGSLQRDATNSPARGRGFLAGQGLSRPVEESKPHGLQEKGIQKGKTPPRESTPDMTKSLSSSLSTDGLDSKDAIPKLGRGSHRKGLSLVSERIPAGLEKFTNEGQKILPNKPVLVAEEKGGTTPPSRSALNQEAVVKDSLQISKTTSASTDGMNIKDDMDDMPILERVAISKSPDKEHGRRQEALMTTQPASVAQKISEITPPVKERPGTPQRGGVNPPDKALLPKPSLPKFPTLEATLKNAGQRVSSDSPDRNIPSPKLQGGRGKMLQEFLQSPELLKSSQIENERRDNPSSSEKEHIQKFSFQEFVKSYETSPRSGSQEGREGKPEHKHFKASPMMRDKIRTPERPMQGVTQECKTPPKNLGRGHQLLLMLKNDAKNSDTSIKQDLFIRLMDKSPLKNAPPMPPKGNGVVYDVSDIESCDESVMQIKKKTLKVPSGEPKGLRKRRDETVSRLERDYRPSRSPGSTTMPMKADAGSARTDKGVGSASTDKGVHDEANRKSKKKKVPTATLR